MPYVASSPSPWSSRMLSILRIVAALLFLEHGTQKIFNFPPAKMAMAFDITSKIGISGVLELVGGALLLLGLFTRPVAFVLAGEMAVAYFTAHFPKSFYPINSMGEPAVLFCFIFLFLMVAGGGAWSVDNVMAAGRNERRSRGK